MQQTDGAAWKGLVRRLGKAIEGNGRAAIPTETLSVLLRGILMQAMEKAVHTPAFPDTPDESDSRIFAMRGQHGRHVLIHVYPHACTLQMLSQM